MSYQTFIKDIRSPRIEFSLKKRKKIFCLFQFSKTTKNIVVLSIHPHTLCNIHYWLEVVHARWVIRLSRFINPISNLDCMENSLCVEVGKALLKIWMSSSFSIPDFDANVLLSYKTIFIMAPRRETVNFIELHQFWDETRVYFFLYRVSTLWFNIMDVSCCVSIVYLSWRLINISWKTEQAWIQYIIIIYAFTELAVNTSRLFRKYSPVSRYYELRWNVDTSCCDALRLIPW